MAAARRCQASSRHGPQLRPSKENMGIADDQDVHRRIWRLDPSDPAAASRTAATTQAAAAPSPWRSTAGIACPASPRQRPIPPQVRRRPRYSPRRDGLGTLGGIPQGDARRPQDGGFSWMPPESVSTASASATSEHVEISERVERRRAFGPAEAELGAPPLHARCTGTGSDGPDACPEPGARIPGRRRTAPGGRRFRHGGMSAGNTRRDDAQPMHVRPTSRSPRPRNGGRHPTMVLPVMRTRAAGTPSFRRLAWRRPVGRTGCRTCGPR